MAVLEYQISTTGLDKFLAAQRTIERELEKNAKRDVARDRRTGSERVRLSQRSAAQIASAEAKADQRAAQARMREEQRLLRWREGVKNRHYQAVERAHHQHEARLLASQRRADAVAARQAQAAARREQQIRERTAGRVTSGIAKGVRGTAGVIGGGLRMAAGAAGLAGTFAVGNALAQRKNLDASLRSVANAGYVQGGPKTREQLYTETKGRVDTISAKGSDPKEIAAAMQAILAKTGNFDVASKGIEEVERLAVATQTPLEDMATTFGTAIESIMRANPGMSTDAAVSEAALLARTFAGHGKFGAVEVSDVASQGAKLVGSASRFTGDRAQSIADMSVMVQQAIKGGSTSAEDAATAVKNLPNDLMKAQKRAGLKESDLYDAQGKFLSLESILPKLFEKTGGKQTKLFGEGNVFGNQSMAAVIPMLEEWQKAGGGEKGAQAVRDVFANFRGQTMSEQEVNESYGFVNQGTDRKLDATVNEFNRQVGDKLLPKLTEMIPRFTALIPQIADLTEKLIDLATWIGENPLKSAFSLLGGMVAKEIITSIVSASIGERVSSVITDLLSKAGGGAPPVPTPGGAPVPTPGPAVGKAGAGGVLGRVAALAVPGLAIASGLLATGDSSLDQTKKDEIAAYRRSQGDSPALSPEMAKRQELYSSKLKAGADPTQARAEVMKIQGMDQLTAALQANTAATQAAGTGTNTTRSEPILKR